MNHRSQPIASRAYWVRCSLQLFVLIGGGVLAYAGQAALAQDSPAGHSQAQLAASAAQRIPGLALQPTTQLPRAGMATDGFTAELSMLDPGIGQLPFQVVLRPTAATFVEDRLLTVRITPQPINLVPAGAQSHFEWSVSITRGQTGTRKIVYLPKWFVSESWSVEICEHGERLPNYSAENSLPSQAPRFGNASLYPPVGAIVESAVKRIGWIAAPGSVSIDAVQSADQVPDLRALLISTNPLDTASFNLTQVSSLPTVLPFLQQQGAFHYSTVEQLPTDWLAMDRCNVWVTQWSTWQAIERDRPAVAAAMRQYLHCGGVLWLLETPDTGDVAAAFKARFPVAALLPDAGNTVTLPSSDAAILSAADPADTNIAAPPAAEGASLAAAAAETRIQFYSPYFPVAVWTELGHQISQRGLPTLPAPSIFSGGYPGGQIMGGPPGSTTFANLKVLNQLDNHIVRPGDFDSLSIGAGKIICCSLTESFPGSYHQWHQMELLSGSALVPIVHHGVDPILGDWNFWTWAIPGVAQPPVYTFIGLLSLFVLLVGPVSYRFVNRYGRSYLMFFIAPLLAIATTLILFAYGFWIDGWVTQARVRQVTWVSGSDGQAVRYWRSTYFAGRTPRSGLHFPSDTRVEPYRMPQTGQQLYAGGQGASASGIITVDDQGVTLSHHFLPARQQVQFVAHRPVQLSLPVEWNLSADGKTAELRNAFDHPLLDIVVCDHQGQYWSGTNIASGVVATLVPLDASDRRDRLTEMYRREQPLMPAGVIPPRQYGHHNVDWISQMMNLVPFAESAVRARPSADAGFVEHWLSFHLDVRNRLPAGTYVAIAPVTDDCLAVPDARLGNSIHYLIGDLP